VLTTSMNLKLKFRSEKFRNSWIIIVLVSLFFIALFDYLTGAFLGFSLFYLIPILFGTWMAGRTTGILLSIISAMVWFIVEYYSGFEYIQPIFAIWNSLIRLGFFLVATILLSKFASLKRGLEETVKDRTTHLSNEIIQRRLLIEQLRRSEEKYRKFFEDDISGDYTATPDGKILMCNPTLVRILGFKSKKDLMSYNAYDLYPKRNMRDKFLNLIKEKGRLENYEIELRGYDGKPVHVIQNVIGTFDEKGDLKELKGYLFDITDRKKLEEQLLQSQKLEAMGRLAGGIAHDFNNLLTVILGYIDILLDSNMKSKSNYMMLEQIQTASKSAISLTSQLLAFSRKQIIQPSITNLNSIIKNLEKMIRRLIGENIKLSTFLAEDLGNVKMDQSQIEQILLNLALNGRDAMPDGGELTFETKNVFLDDLYASQHISVKAGNYIMLSVSDTGIGIDKKIKDKIFDPFFTTKEKGKGTGLGLATIYGIVKQSGGNIWVDSEPGKGATFKIYLPRVFENEVIEAKPVSTPQSFKGSETILIIEDDQGILNLVYITLKDYGYKVQRAKNGKKAIEICKKYQDKIRLVITDIIMPKMSGKELAIKINKLSPGIKILFMSGYADNVIVHHGILDKGVNLLQKPFDSHDLVKKVREILDSK